MYIFTLLSLYISICIFTGTIGTLYSQTRINTAFPSVPLFQNHWYIAPPDWCIRPGWPSQTVQIYPHPFFIFHPFLACTTFGTSPVVHFFARFWWFSPFFALPSWTSWCPPWLPLQTYLLPTHTAGTWTGIALSGSAGLWSLIFWWGSFWGKFDGRGIPPKNLIRNLPTHPLGRYVFPFSVSLRFVSFCVHITPKKNKSYLVAIMQLVRQLAWSNVG